MTVIRTKSVSTQNRYFKLGRKRVGLVHLVMCSFIFFPPSERVAVRLYTTSQQQKINNNNLCSGCQGQLNIHCRLRLFQDKKVDVS